VLLVGYLKVIVGVVGRCSHVFCSSSRDMHVTIYHTGESLAVILPEPYAYSTFVITKVKAIVVR